MLRGQAAFTDYLRLESGTQFAHTSGGWRPGYAPQVATAILGYVGRAAGSIDAADIGAGTGIWTRMLAANGLRSVVAVEPNDDMRRQGMETSPGTDLVWHKRFGGSY